MLKTHLIINEIIMQGNLINYLIIMLFNYVNVTLLLEKQQKEFTSNKPIYPLQFGTIIHIIGLSLTFKTIKQKIQVFQLSELISFSFRFCATLS